MADPDRCRNCEHELPPRYGTCPQCGVRQHEEQGYEWKTKGTWMGEPLVHIAFGCDADGRIRKARGILAIGQHASGAVAIGIVAFGGISVGVLSCGLVSVGVVSVALGAALGVNAFGPIAIGVLGVGYAAGGVEAIGWKILFSAR